VKRGIGYGGTVSQSNFPYEILAEVPPDPAPPLRGQCATPAWLTNQSRLHNRAETQYVRPSLGGIQARPWASRPTDVGTITENTAPSVAKASPDARLLDDSPTFGGPRRHADAVRYLGISFTSVDSLQSHRHPASPLSIVLSGPLSQRARRHRALTFPELIQRQEQKLVTDQRGSCSRGSKICFLPIAQNAGPLFRPRNARSDMPGAGIPGAVVLDQRGPSGPLPTGAHLVQQTTAIASVALSVQCWHSCSSWDGATI